MIPIKIGIVKKFEIDNVMNDFKTQTQGISRT